MKNPGWRGSDGMERKRRERGKKEGGRKEEREEVWDEVWDGQDKHFSLLVKHTATLVPRRWTTLNGLTNLSVEFPCGTLKMATLHAWGRRGNVSEQARYTACNPGQG